MVTATSLVGIVAGLATAIVTRSIDRRIVLWSLTVLLIVSNLLSATAGNLPLLLLARVLLGISLSGFWSMAAATAMRLVPAPRRSVHISAIFGDGGTCSCWRPLSVLSCSSFRC